MPSRTTASEALPNRLSIAWRSRSAPTASGYCSIACRASRSSRVDGSFGRSVIENGRCRGIRCRLASPCGAESDAASLRRLPPSRRLRRDRRTAHRAGDLAELHAEHAGELARVAGPQRGIADLGDDRRGRPQRRDAPLDGLEVVAGERVPDHELEHRRARLDERAHRGVAAREPQVARVESVGRDGHEGLRREPLLLGERAHRRLLAGRVAVEREDDLADARVVAEHAPQHLDVVDAERRCRRWRSRW